MRKQPHIIAIDLDGTLLTDKKTISEQSRNTLKALLDQGHIIVIATGRSNRVSISYYNELGLTTPLINSNGAVIHHPRDKDWGNYHTPLKHQTAMDIIDLCYDLRTSNILASVYDTVFLDQFDQHIVDFYGVSKQDTTFRIGNVKKYLKEDPSLMMIYPEESHIDAIHNYLDDTHAKTVEHRNWGPPFNVIEIMNYGMNKATALKQVAEHYNIPQDRIIAFGDEGNDLEMIEYAGVGVAMDNGIKELKSIANYITDTNENDGVAQFLADYFQLSSL